MFCRKYGIKRCARLQFNTGKIEEKYFFLGDQFLFDISGEKDILTLLDAGSSKCEQVDKLFWHIIFGEL